MSVYMEASALPADFLAGSSMIYFREGGQEWVDTGVAESSPFPLPRNLEGSFLGEARQFCQLPYLCLLMRVVVVALVPWILGRRVVQCSLGVFTWGG